MDLSALLDEYDLSIDDVRWYLASRLTASLLSHKEEPQELTQRIWAGALERELYDMEERFMRALREDINRGMADEPHVRDILDQIRITKIQRGRA
jgi:hypothetical protein